MILLVTNLNAQYTGYLEIIPNRLICNCYLKVKQLYSSVSIN